MVGLLVIALGVASWSRWLGVMLVCSLHGCSTDTFSCFSNEQCVRQDQQGTCEPIGFCAYPDAECESGLRFSPNAEESFANTCVSLFEPGEITTSTGPAPTTTTTGDRDVGNLECGNGVLDPGEDCDDGNDVPGDGCGPTCRFSGTELWSQHHAGPAGADDRASVVIGRNDGRVVMAGEQGAADGTRSAIVLAYERDGESLVGDPWIDDEPGDVWLRDIAVRDTDVIVVGERLSDGPAGARAWYAILDVWLDLQTEGAVDTLASERIRGVVETGEGFAMVGSQDGVGWARWVETSRPDWRGDTMISVSAVGARADGAFLVVGEHESGTVLWWVISASGVTLLEGATSGDEVRTAGFDVLGRPVLGGVQGGLPWLAVYDLDGMIAWSVANELGLPAASIEAVDATPDGAVYVTGIQDDSRGWAGRVDTEGVVEWIASVRSGGQNVRPSAVHYAEDDVDTVLYVAGSEANDAGDQDMFIVALEP